MSVEFAFSHMIIINYHMFIMMFITLFFLIFSCSTGCLQSKPISI